MKVKRAAIRLISQIVCETGFSWDDSILTALVDLLYCEDEYVLKYCLFCIARLVRMNVRVNEELFDEIVEEQLHSLIEGGSGNVAGMARMVLDMIYPGEED
jgi:hypothetical protein